MAPRRTSACLVASNSKVRHRSPLPLVPSKRYLHFHFLAQIQRWARIASVHMHVVGLGSTAIRNGCEPILPREKPQAAGSTDRLRVHQSLVQPCLKSTVGAYSTIIDATVNHKSIDRAEENSKLCENWL